MERKRHFGVERYAALLLLTVCRLGPAGVVVLHRRGCIGCRAGSCSVTASLDGGNNATLSTAKCEWMSTESDGCPHLVALVLCASRMVRATSCRNGCNLQQQQGAGRRAVRHA